MNAIIGFTALAAAHVNQPDQVQEYLNKISTSGQHLFPPEPDSAESAAMPRNSHSTAAPSLSVLFRNRTIKKGMRSTNSTSATTASA